MNDSLLETDARCPNCGARVREGAGVCLSCGHVLAEIEYGPAPVDGISAELQPQAIGSFRILRILGQGGSGIVCEAWDEEAGRPVALKLVDGDLYFSAPEEARLEREAWISGSLDHPNVVKVYAHGTKGPWHYIALELVGGPSLHHYLHGAAGPAGSAEPHMAAADADHIRRMTRLLAGVADALQHIHGRGVVHRDVKPSNLVLTADLSRLMLTDFGLAETAGGPGEDGRAGGSGAVGTNRYMAPELSSRSSSQARTADPLCDIYSLGVSLYEAVTLAFPFDELDDERYARAAAQEEPVPLRRRNPAASEELELLVRRCLERDPGRRVQSAGELADELRSF